MFKKTIKYSDYKRESKTFDITVYSVCVQRNIRYKCTSFYLMNYFLVLRTLDDGEQYINLDTILSFSVNEIKEGAEND